MTNQSVSFQATAYVPITPRAAIIVVMRASADAAAAGAEGGSVYRTISHCHYGTVFRRSTTSSEIPRPVADLT